MLRSELPIDPHLPRIVAEVADRGCVVIKARPGAGKTTRVPLALAGLWHGRTEAAALLGNRADSERKPRCWLVVQPRRVAARTTARRMAEETGSPLGDKVGYEVRFERQLSAQTQVLVVTEGVLLRKLHFDPFLECYAGVILDEFHERRLDSDVAIALLRQVRDTVRPDLKIVVMSATLDTAVTAKFLGDCPVISCDSPVYPVEIRYHDLPLQFGAERPLSALVRQTAADTRGHVLVFLPGVGEIRRLEHQLRIDGNEDDWQVLLLYGGLPAAEQDRVFADVGNRKIILATNVAETSVTIQGVTAVVDTGLARVAEFDPSSGMNRLVLKPISRASADQRSGRAGRTSAGTCLRLWSEAAQRTRPDYETPEIRRVELSATALQLLAWGETDLINFPWYESPPDWSRRRALSVLAAIDATISIPSTSEITDSSNATTIDSSQGNGSDATDSVAETRHSLTELGRHLAEIPAPPRIARFLWESRRWLPPQFASLAAAYLMERDPFLGNARQAPARLHHDSDLLLRLEALADWDRTGRTEFECGTIQADAARVVWRAQQQWAGLIRELPPVERSPVAAAPVNSQKRSEALGRALLAAIPDRLVRRREAGSPRGLMVGGRGVVLANSSTVRGAELFLAVDAQSAEEEVRVQVAHAIEREWLTGRHLQTRVDVEFDDATLRLQARRRQLWMDLVLDEAPASLPMNDDAAVILARAARRHWSEVFPDDNQGWLQLLHRVRCVRSWCPEAGFPDWSDAALPDRLEQLAYGCRSLADIRAASWTNVFRAELSPHQQQLLDQFAPEKIRVPSGSMVAIHYADGAVPILAVRIQEIFGWTDTPRIAGGRVKLLLHLLAPNHRPQQITDDLKSFWSTAYQQVRGELRRRYPRHAWPEDPWTAVAEHRPQRKSTK